MYTHLHLHSHYSLLQALGEPKAYIARAKELGMTHLALTDYNGLYGTIEFYKYCKKSSIVPIIGVELSYTQDRTIKSKQELNSAIVLLAKNYEGYQNLLKLTTHGNLEGWNGKARIDKGLLQSYHTGIYCLIGGKQSILATMILMNESHGKQTEILQSLIDIFGHDAVILELIVGDQTKDPEIAHINTSLQDLAEQFGLMLTCSPNVHMVKQEDKESYEIFLCIKEGKRIFDADRPRVTQPIWLMSEEEIHRQLTIQGFSSDMIHQLIQNTHTIAENIQLTIPLGIAMFPKYESSPEIHSLYQQFQQEQIVT